MTGPGPGGTSRSRGAGVGVTLGAALLIGVLAARGLIAETSVRVDLSFLPFEARAGGVNPATSAWLDFVQLLGASCVLALCAPKWNAIVAVGAALWGIAVGLSCAAAEDVRSAILAASTGSVMLLSAIALVGGVRSVRGLAVPLAAAILATTATNAAKCAFQAGYEQAETASAWAERKAQLARQGVDVESPGMRNYERRLASGEVTGHLAHANLAGACMAAGATLLLSLVIARRRLVSLQKDDSGTLVLSLALLGLLTWAVWASGSLGAWAAGLVGAAVVLLVRVGSWPARSVVVAWSLGMVGLVALVAGWGVQTSSLPHPSLAFRWMYWVTAIRAWWERPLTGLGGENFAAAYLLLKPLAGSEEVRDPHSFWVTLLVEFGPAALAAGLTLFGWMLWRLAKLVDQPGRDSGAAAPLGGMNAAAISAVALLIAGVFGGLPLLNPNVALLWTFEVAAVWLGAALIGAIGASRCTSRGLAVGSLAALLVLLSHGLIDFTLDKPAGMALTVLLVALGFAARTDDAPSGTAADAWRPARWARCGVAAIACAAFAMVVVNPTRQTHGALDELMQELAAIELRGEGRVNAADVPRVVDLAERVARADPLDADGPLTAARQLAEAGVLFRDRVAATAWLDAAVRLLTLAAERNDRQPGLMSARARVHEARRDWTALDESSILAELSAAALAWDDSARLNPTGLANRLSAGAAHARLWEQFGLRESASRAIEHLEFALQIESTRPRESADALPDGDLSRLRARVDALRAGLSE